MGTSSDQRRRQPRDQRQPQQSGDERLSVALVYERSVTALADRVAAGLSHAHTILVAGPVDGVSPSAAAAADLVVIGSPATSLHSLRRTMPTPRRSAEDTGFPSLREWLAALPSPRSATPPCPCFIAAFDTRHTRAGRTQLSASSHAARVLTRRGFELAGRPMSFLLDGLTEDPAYGESVRAERWGHDLAAVTLARLHGDPSGWWAHPSGTDHSTIVPFGSPGTTRQ